MTNKPDFAAQSGELMTSQERDWWIDETKRDFRKNGAVAFRLSLNEFDNLILIEGWKSMIYWKDVPPPHFLFTT